MLDTSFIELDPSDTILDIVKKMNRNMVTVQFSLSKTDERLVNHERRIKDLEERVTVLEEKVKKLEKRMDQAEADIRALQAAAFG